MVHRTPRIRIFSYYRPEGQDPALVLAEVLRRMAEKARIAAARGVTLLLENEKGIYGDTAARVLDILQAVDSPALGHAFDPANYLEVGQPIDPAWELLRSRTVHFHVKDYDPATEKNVPAGQGQGQILAGGFVLRGWGYAHSLTCPAACERGCTSFDKPLVCPAGAR